MGILGEGGLEQHENGRQSFWDSKKIFIDCHHPIKSEI